MLNIRRNKAQAILEYAILLAVICAVFTGMFFYMKRAAKMKVNAVETQVQYAINL